MRRAVVGGDQPQLVEAADVKRVRTLLALGGVPWGELDDGVQQVHLKLLEQQTRPDRPTIRNPGGWLSVVASRVAVDWHRAQGREAGLRARLAERWGGRSQVDPPEEHQVLALAVADVLEELPAAQRQVLVLRFYADLPVRDIARMLGLPEGTVKSRLHAAAGALRSRLGSEEGI
ncbi:RNA polymerase sigma factor [Streptomyces sp. NPDC002205]|uniref:RNA polymerase sigma factor n=1 Tax=Streptomyces sp. NPDC002205 TaxID=3154411 RepID=UPI003329FE49